MQGQGQGQGPSLQGLDLQGQVLDSQGPGQGLHFTYSYLLQVAAKPTIAIKQQQ